MADHRESDVLAYILGVLVLAISGIAVGIASANAAGLAAASMASAKPRFISSAPALAPKRFGAWTTMASVVSYTSLAVVTLKVIMASHILGSMHRLTSIKVTPTNLSHFKYI